MTTLGATLDSVAPGMVEIALTPHPAISQQHGFVHGGAVSAIADSAAGYAALSLMPADTGVLTTEFKINDVFDPEAHTLNGQKLEHVYPIVVPDLPPPNAKILRARGAEMAVAMDETQTVYRVYALKFGIVLSSVRPGEALYVDEEQRWAFIRLEERGKVKPSVWAFRLD